MRGRTSRRVRAATTAALAVLALVLAACAKTPQDTLSPEGPVARRIDRLFDPVFWIAAVIFFLVEGILVFALFRFRHRPGRPIPVQVHGSKRLEIGWTLAPAIILAAVAIPTILTIFSLSRPPQGNVVNVEITAHQWWWQVDYPDFGVTTANEIHVPTGQPVYFTLKSIDVIHSFWIPPLGGKQDVVPGHINHLWYQADHPGTYLGQCAEFCGLSHANMRLRAIAETPAGFAAWAAQQKGPAQTPSQGLAAKGAQLFAQGACIGCHTILGVPNATAQVGPSLTHIASRTTFAGATFPLTPENLTKWLDDPPAMKPGSKMPDYDLTPDEIQALVAYLETLK